MSEMCEEYDRRNFSGKEDETQRIRDNTILKRAVLIMDERLKMHQSVEVRLKMELQTKD